MSDNVFSIPETLISTGDQYSQKAQDILTLHSSLDAFSQTLYNSLPNEHARYSIDNFWTKWSAALLNIAADCEDIGNLLVKAAIAYLQTDEAISKAFHGDQAEQDKIKAEIDQANQQLDTFKQQYDQEKQKNDNVDQRADTEKKDATFHTGQANVLVGAGVWRMENIAYRVDKDGNLTEVWMLGNQEVTRQMPDVFVNGHWVKAGSDEAKAIYNNPDGGPTVNNAPDVPQNVWAHWTWW